MGDVEGLRVPAPSETDPSPSIADADSFEYGEVAMPECGTRALYSEGLVRMRMYCVISLDQRVSLQRGERGR